MANIEYDPQKQLFHLHNDTFSYIIQVIRGYLVKRYCGPALERFPVLPSWKISVTHLTFKMMRRRFRSRPCRLNIVR